MVSCNPQKGHVLMVLPFIQKILKKLFHLSNFAKTGLSSGMHLGKLGKVPGGVGLFLRLCFVLEC